MLVVDIPVEPGCGGGLLASYRLREGDRASCAMDVILVHAVQKGFVCT